MSSSANILLPEDVENYVCRARVLTGGSGLVIVARMFALFVMVEASKTSWNRRVLSQWLERDAAWLVEGDPALTAHWTHKDMPDGQVRWSPRQRLAVRRALKIEAKARAPLPRVFIYPYPKAFANASSVRNLAASYTLRNGSRAELTRYFQLNYGRSLKKQKLRLRGDSYTWEPLLYNVGRYEDTKKDRVPCEAWANRSDVVSAERECVFSISSQHNLGLVVHRALATSYPRLVDDPTKADLFFVPDYFDTTRMLLKLDDYCKIVGPVWRDHLSSFRFKKKSFAERNKMRDHFVVIGRAWHDDDGPLEDMAKRMRQPKFRAGGGDCGYHATLRPQRLQLEAQHPLIRACANVHPVPYASFLPWGPSSQWGASWFLNKRRDHLASAFFNEGPTRDDVRAILHRQCEESHECFIPTVNEHGHFDRNGLEATYRRSVFALQPPGVSAARKGIVDSLLAGAIPVLIRREPPPGGIAAHDQRDLWPWNWPGQGASSLSLNDTQVASLMPLLRAVDAEQLALMRAVIAAQARFLAWPLDTWLAPSSLQASTPRNALEVAMRHLYYVANRSIVEDVAC